MPSYDPNRIAQLEERLSAGPESGASALAELEMLADLYLQADSYVPALETIERLLSCPAARTLSPGRRAALESKAIACRIAQGDAHAALGQCRDLLRDESLITPRSLLARIHWQCGRALFMLTRLAEARVHAARALELADESADLAASAAALNLMGTVRYREGRLAEARDDFEQALALFRRVGDEYMAAAARSNLGLIHKTLCEWDAAASHLTAAADAYRRLGRLAALGRALVNLGIVHQKRGDWRLAEGHYRDAERVFAQIGDHHHLAHVHVGLGNVARLERRFAEAETSLRSALERARANGAAREEALALEFLGELEHDRGRDEEALVRYADALSIAERVAPEGDLVVEVERRRAEALVALGRLDEASAACERARRLARLVDDRLEHAVTWRVGGEIAAARGRLAEAGEQWSIALARLAECRERLELGRTHLLVARATAEPREKRRHLLRAVALFAELSGGAWLEEAEAELQRALGGASGAELAPARPASLLGRRHRAPSLVACSNAMRGVESLARRAASTELSVLVTGETGTGKELIARTIHALSPRAARPFLALNCGAIKADLALSQLFGHRKGAFTGAHGDAAGLVEAAHGGTLFLDEVGELPLDVQVTLLRFLETGEYLRLGETQVRRSDVRVIAATNRELRSGDAERLFRRDLLFRLNEIEIRVPSLRERAEDVVPLARHFLAFYGGLEGPQLSLEAEGMLRAYTWPGNVRELENVMKRVAALHAGERVLDAAALLPFLTAGRPESAAAGEPRATRSDEEREAILAAWREARGNKSRLAGLLGVSRKTLYARLKRLSIDLG
uniref:Tetratricopeptide repeat protein n=1 Tax=Eiseniibacteriota bacterium TaxID=2212470 RepID=A0A832I3I0_UNCEI